MHYTKLNPPEKIKLNFPQTGRTKQSFKDECDINKILKRFQDKGQLPQNMKSGQIYGDFSEIADYQTSLNKVISAKNTFDSLPAKVRERFSNDPWKFLSFASDANNLQEMVSLGLANKLPEPQDTSKKAVEAAKTDSGKEVK